MTYKEYFKFYLELDIMLLTDYFESLRTKLCETHKIDPAYHQGLASYSQACMMYLTKAKLHLIEPVDVSKVIVDNCRGPIFPKRSFHSANVIMSIGTS